VRVYVRLHLPTLEGKYIFRVLFKTISAHKISYSIKATKHAKQVWLNARQQLLGVLVAQQQDLITNIGRLTKTTASNLC